MKHILLILGTILWLCTAILAQQPEDAVRRSNEDLSAQVQRLEAEVRTLRVALLQLQLTFQKAQLAHWESELRAIQAEKQKADQRETARLVQLQQVIAALAGTALEAETRAEMEGLRASLANPAPAHKREELDRREHEVAVQLEREQKHWHQLLQAAQALGLETASGRH